MPVCRLSAKLFGAASIPPAECEAIRISTYRGCSPVYFRQVCQTLRIDTFDDVLPRMRCAHLFAEGAAHSRATDILTITQERGGGDSAGLWHFPLEATGSSRRATSPMPFGEHLEPNGHTRGGYIRDDGDARSEGGNGTIGSRGRKKADSAGDEVTRRRRCRKGTPERDRTGSVILYNTARANVETDG
jgi:hypothetical protein